jgi:hypothetical protein
MRRRQRPIFARTSSNRVAWAALAVSIVALVTSMTGLGAARTPSSGSGSSASVIRLSHGRIPARVLPRIPASDLPRIPARLLPKAVPAHCPTGSVDIGTWCLDEAPYALTAAQAGLNNYFFATRACEAEGGYLPTAAQLIGAANKVLLESVNTDNPTTATIDQDPTDGLKDQREMSATLITTAAGSDAAGSEGVSVGSTGNPKLGEPDPTPEPAVPEPETLQYVTVYDNFEKAGFAGSEPVATPENFRCAYNQISGKS